MHQISRGSSSRRKRSANENGAFKLKRIQRIHYIHGMPRQPVAEISFLGLTVALKVNGNHPAISPARVEMLRSNSRVDMVQPKINTIGRPVPVSSKLILAPSDEVIISMIITFINGSVWRPGFSGGSLENQGRCNIF